MPSYYRSPARTTGFTLLEMSVVLVVIALIIGAVSVGRDVYRSAEAERIGSEFVQGWMIAYDRYVQGSGVVPGDDPANPSGRVYNQAERELCRDELRNEMLRRGVALPQGRAEGAESRYVYRDSQGNPQELEVCFLNLNNWAEPSTGLGYTTRSRNVMRLTGLTPELANQLDARIDGRVDARFGRMREINAHSRTDAISSTNPVTNPWSRDDRHDYNGGYRPDAQVAVMTGYVRMNQ
ncbi:type II secretion system protein [Stenotrophomonas mori]|uniref:Prepilin-type N-terminal cleavage/methylation domain-containing protein n=1 Tax=Stenotrophomonas mori TaxID=2871096 RepID=A0ABT0SIL3_9GAMM|nr:prepilin-type N-terminal cleavage/methylation domain-containing protein [Stenotrophomonas mori]MCL7715149.1 prepilin-type N-terminal cleavage/methylation domain-containing protein [Stenotrophomonas mori]